jgi:agmatinase
VRTGILELLGQEVSRPASPHRAVCAYGKRERITGNHARRSFHYDSTAIEQYNNANTFVHAKNEKLIDVDASFHVGLRDTELGGQAGEVQEARDLGYRVITMSDIESRGVHFLIDLLRQELVGRQIYLCWDMDVFDPSVAPGVVTPAWGGITVREGLQILRGLRGLDIVHFDLNTVSPPHDIFGQTASLAAQLH